ncbi:FKBP-type peptidyl-prolyl cis-trans isomerase [Mangrovitalea sediminis]|uniref:FKBP-type peptidyl-prolyl cis-trans isomerase n=1 Tax=Mangrovitalea sediminis TaxID=1982043 RepID=UPI000BE4C359|nr:peptidylprolyl isomerase [Mangrovitalea sediminis]
MSEPRVVTIHYTLTNDAGEVLDSSREREPLSYLEGAQNIISGLEEALNEQEAGAQLKVSIEAEDAYGEQREELVQPVPRSAFEGVDNVEPGMQFQAQTPGGPQVVRVVRVEEDTVVIDANHPLAGQRLHFDVEVVGTREATEEETTHGHAH